MPSKAPKRGWLSRVPFGHVSLKPDTLIVWQEGFKMIFAGHCMQVLGDTKLGEFHDARKRHEVAISTHRALNSKTSTHNSQSLRISLFLVLIDVRA